MTCRSSLKLYPVSLWDLFCLSARMLGVVVRMAAYGGRQHRPQKAGLIRSHQSKRKAMRKKEQLRMKNSCCNKEVSQSSIVAGWWKFNMIVFCHAMTKSRSPAGVRTKRCSGQASVDRKLKIVSEFFWIYWSCFLSLFPITLPPLAGTAGAAGSYSCNGCTNNAGTAIMNRQQSYCNSERSHSVQESPYFRRNLWHRALPPVALENQLYRNNQKHMRNRVLKKKKNWQNAN